MKIGIFGDSFADTLVCDKEEVSKHNIIGWPDLLKTEYNIVNFSRGGTSLFYSYMLFKEKQTDFDKIIFVLTDNARWSNLMVIPNKISVYGDNYFSVGSFAMVEHIKTDKDFKKYIDMEVQAKLDALEMYYGYLYSDSTWFMNETGKLIIDDIIKIRPDTLVITGGNFPSFHTLFNHKTSLATFSYSWLNNWPSYRKLTTTYGGFPWKEKRTVCHLSKEVNEVVALEVSKAIKTGVWEPNVPEFIPAEHSNFDFYYHI